MSVKIVYRDREFEVRAGMTLRAAIMKCDIHPESVLPVIGGELVTDDYLLKEGDQVKLVAVISGGRG
jgi:sulfur carrier protein ThiS